MIHVTTSKDTHMKTQIDMPKLLLENNLEINKTKTELYEIPKPKPPPPPTTTIEELLKHKDDKPLWSELDWLINFKPKNTPNWKECKLLGTYLGTDEDINNRKKLALETHRNFEKVFKSKIISTKLKLKTFKIYIECVFLYNSETWSVNKTIEKKIDSFQRRLLRYTLGIEWPDVLSDQMLKMFIGDYEPWSKNIRRRRLNLLGHIIRLPEDTPIKIAITENFKKSKNKMGRPKQTWLRTIRDDLMKINIKLDLDDKDSIKVLTDLTKDRKNWKQTIKVVLIQ